MCVRVCVCVCRGFELWTSQLTVSLHELPISLLLGVFYIFYHNGWRYAKTRTLLYFFLNWARKDAYVVVAGLLALFGSCFTCGHLVSARLRTQAWGAPVLAIGLLAIMKLRTPKGVVVPN